MQIEELRRRAARSRALGQYVTEVLQGMKNANLTPHIGCSPEDFAKTVLMPGDPLRAKMIAETYLTDAELVNNVRGVHGYTGYYEGKRVSVMASGMGMPSIGIYSYELYNIFGVENIIRIGSAGGIHPDLKLYDIVIGQGACYDSLYPNQFGVNGTFAPIADYGLLRKAVDECEKRGLRHKVGNLLSSDCFSAARRAFCASRTLSSDARTARTSDSSASFFAFTACAVCCSATASCSMAFCIRL